jgi:hypothetical protein
LLAQGGDAALAAAAEKGHVVCLTRLLEKGAELEAANRSER